MASLWTTPASAAFGVPDLDDLQVDPEVTPEMIQAAIEQGRRRSVYRRGTMEDLLKAYDAATDRVVTATKVLEMAQTDKNKAAKAIFDAHGAGPHTIDGQKKLIIRRGETFFFKIVKVTK